MALISTRHIKEAVYDMCKNSNYNLPADVSEAMLAASRQEKSSLGKQVLAQLVENSHLAREQNIALCQDTGMIVVFLEIGQEVSLTGQAIEEAINEGVRSAYQDSFFRNSIVHDPLIRDNTNDNTPAVVHYKIVPGDTVKIVVSPKGFGSENMSALRMLKPSQGLDGVKAFVLETISTAGGNPCPPMIIGVGIGGTMEKVALLAKEALMRPINQDHILPHVASLEHELLAEINKLGIGPQGFGGSVSALGVNIEVYPTHIAGLPVAVNVSCHVTRHQQRILAPKNGGDLL